MDIVLQTKAIVEAAGLPVTVFSDVRPNPVERNVMDGQVRYRNNGCDGIIAMGGGSALDVAKAIALLCGQSASLFDFEDVGDNWKRANAATIAPIVAVPTTSGTGSEVGRCSVITDPVDQRKKIIFHPRMLPARVIDDPALTTSMPPMLTAQVGMDALGHNLEAFFASGYHPMADGIALEGARLIKDYLLSAVRAGENIEARSQMMIASTMGAAAFQKGLGAVHAMAHAVSAALDTHHGLAISVFMPYVVAFNMKTIGEKAARLKRLLGLKQGIVDWLLEFRETLGLPHTAAELGVTAEMVPGLTVSALRDPTLPTNPRALSEAEIERLYRHALDGTLP
jgi:alcohol dehydrogenase class IV